jgi:anti-sigma regulatory factor (Ser/Thr protein kinase)
VHGALFCRGRDELLSEVTALVDDARRAGDPTVVLLPGEILERLGSRPGAAGEQVRFEDMAVLGRNPARILPVFQELVDGHRGTVRVIGQPVWPGRSEAETTEALRHESLVNSVLATSDARIVCVYDTGLLGETTLDAARRVHPHVGSTARRLRTSPDYVEDGPGERQLRNGLDRPYPPVEEIPVTVDLAVLRHRVASSRLTAPLSGPRREDFLLAVNEAAANALEYGEAPRIARLWRNGASVIGEVVARGRIDDPLVGRRRPDPRAVRGRGLWIVNQLCDLVQLRQDGPSTRLRLHMYVG